MQNLGMKKEYEVDYFFFHDKKLNKIQIDIITAGFSNFEIAADDEQTVVTHKVRATEDELHAEYDRMVTLAEQIGINYDTWDVRVADDPKPVPMEPFHKHFEPGDVLAFPLSNGNFGHLIFVSGGKNKHDFFEISRITSPAPATVQEVETGPLHYTQAIPAYLDPLVMTRIGHVKIFPKTLEFKMTIGFPSLPELEALEAVVGMTGQAEGNWLLFLDLLLKSGRRIPHEGYMIYRCNISAKGKQKCFEPEVFYHKIPQHHADLYSFGVNMGLDDIDRALTGGLDLLYLQSKVG